jgi:tetratricopeptide (TPR) repeat protein
MADLHDLKHLTHTSHLLRASWLSQSYLVGHPAEQVDRYADVLVLYTRVIELAPNNILAHLLQGKALDNLTREDEAKTAYIRALELAKQAQWKGPITCALSSGSTTKHSFTSHSLQGLSCILSRCSYVQRQDSRFHVMVSSWKRYDSGSIASSIEMIRISLE